jgi:uncharacterized protein (TIGR04255 family)
MSKKHLRNAPIIEAVLDIRVQPSPDVTIPILQSLHERVRDQYPEVSGRMEIEARVQSQAPFETIDEASVQAKQVGFFFWARDKRQAMQARLDGFSFSRLRPYQEWELLRDEAMKLWVAYSEIARPTGLTRIALRYINRIEVPLSGDFDDYLNTFARLGKDCPQTISELFMRVVTHHSLGTVVLSEAIDKNGATDSFVPVILDIDAFRSVSLPIAAKDEMWSILEELRSLKNDVFFSSITPKTEALYS